jgi:hypothetical protein
MKSIVWIRTRMLRSARRHRSLAAAATIALGVVVFPMAATAVGTGAAGASNLPPVPSSCFPWSSSSTSVDNRTSLQQAVDTHSCVEIQTGVHVISGPISLSSYRTVKGLGAQSVLKADASLWVTTGYEAVLSTVAEGALSQSVGVRISGLTIDGSGVAANAVAASATVDQSLLTNSRCSGVTINSPGSVIVSNLITHSAKDTVVLRAQGNRLYNCRGEYIPVQQYSGFFYQQDLVEREFTYTKIPSSCLQPKYSQNTQYCLYVAMSAAEEGAGIYIQSYASNETGIMPTRLAPVIRNNTITESVGPALDVNGAWDGRFEYNLVYANSSWAGVSLYGASNWVISNNQVFHPSDQPGHPSEQHKYCRDQKPSAPSGVQPLGRSAAIFLCQDTDVNNLITTNNFISNNRVAGYYGILSVGDRNHRVLSQPQYYLVPRRNVITRNDPEGSIIGCADEVPHLGWASEKNTWIDNFCAGPGLVGPPLEL